MREPLTRRLVRGLLEEYEGLDRDKVGVAAGRALFDFAVCTAAGGGFARGEADAGERAASDAAAAHALDRDDLHWASLTHPGGVVWPVVLALGEEAGAGGREALRAAAVGYEATARLAAALGTEHRRFWHATATAGTVGAAVAGALVLDLGLDGVAAAAGHAVSVAGGSLQCVFERSGTRVFHRSHAARSSVAAALAARAGLGATRLGLEAERGLFAATAPAADPERVLARPARWAIVDLTLRTYAASGFAHTAIEAALELAPIEAPDVHGVRVELPASAAALAGIPRPASPEEAWWSVPYAVAVCLVEGQAEALMRRDLLADERVGRLLAVTDLEPRAPAAPDDLGARVTVELSDGSIRSSEAAVHLGHPSRPLADEDLLAKRAMLRPGADREEGARALDTSLRLGERPLAELIAELRSLV